MGCTEGAARWENLTCTRRERCRTRWLCCGTSVIRETSLRWCRGLPRTEELNTHHPGENGPYAGKNLASHFVLRNKAGTHVQKKLVTKKNWAKKLWQAWEWQAPPLPPPTKYARHTSWCVASQKHEATLWLKKYCGSYKCALSLSMFTWQNDLGKIPGSGGSVSACEEMGALGSCPLVFLGECQRSGKDRYDLEVSTWMHRQCWQR